MTPSLHDLQAGFARAILTGDTTLAPWIIGDGIAAASRLDIHANHYRQSLVDALRTTFAPVRRLVGEAFFDSMARRYVVRHPPTGPCLFEYGAGLAGFAAGDPAGRGVPFLADMLRFAFALNRAHTAPDATPITAGDLAAIDSGALASLRVSLHPGVTLIASDYPIAALWRLATDETGAEPTVDLAAGGECLVCWRDDGRPAWRRTGPGEHAFLAALAAGQPLGAATDTAIASDPMFHLAEALGLALHQALLGGVNPEGATS